MYGRRLVLLAALGCCLLQLSREFQAGQPVLMQAGELLKLKTVVYLAEERAFVCMCVLCKNIRGHSIRGGYC